MSWSRRGNPRRGRPRPTAAEAAAAAAALEESTTLYVGNLSFYTTEEQIFELFSKAGRVQTVIMGLNRKTRQPCGFCFVQYFQRSDAECCLKYLNQTLLDDRAIRCDWDRGFEEGRQYGRGKSGGQVRDEFRESYDEGRGGYGVKGLYSRGLMAPSTDGDGAGAGAGAGAVTAAAADAAAATDGEARVGSGGDKDEKEDDGAGEEEEGEGKTVVAERREPEKRKRDEADLEEGELEE